MTDNNTQKTYRHMVYRFGNFQLDPATRELSRYGEPVALPPKSFDAIVYLMENHDRAVGRDELISAVWGRVDASDAVVAQTLLRARRAINDTGDKQSRIRTVPRYGYQWVGTFERVEMAGTQSPGRDQGTITNELTTRRPARWSGAVMLLAAIIVVIALVFSISGTDDTPVAPSGEPGLTAVLPVQVQPETAETAWIRLGAMDYVASRLREQPGLVVLPSGRTLSLVDDTATLEQVIDRIRRTTGAQHILLPRAISEGDEWRFRLVLDDGQSQQVFEIKAGTPLGAAAAASDMMLRRLGIDGPSPPQPTELTERLQQVDAELLAGQLANARALIAAAPRDQDVHPQLRVRQGQLEFRAGQVDVAGQIFSELLESDARIRSDVRARALMGLGAVELRRADFMASESLYDQALALLVESGISKRDPALEGNAYNGRGVARVELGRHDDGIADLARARIAMTRAGDEVEAAAVATNIAVMEVRRGHPARAVRELESAADTFERFGVNDNLAVTLMVKSGAELQLLQPKNALRDSRRADDIGDELENPRLRRSISISHITALLANGQLTAAGHRLDAEEAGETPSPATPQLKLRLLLETGAFTEALALARRELPKTQEPGADFTLLAIQAAILGQNPELATEWRDHFLAKVDSDSPTSGFETAFARALVMMATQASAEKTDAAFLDALETAGPHLTPESEVRAGAAFVIQLVNAGQLDRASEVLGTFSPYAEHDYRAARAALALYEALDEPVLAAAAETRVARLAGERDPSLPVIY